MTERLTLSDIGSHGPNWVLLGINEDGEPFGVDRRHQAHGLTSGAPGQGKGIQVRAEQAHDLAVGNHIIILQPKPGENGWLTGAATIATTGDEMTAALAWAVEQQDQRQRLCENHIDPTTGVKGADNVYELPNTPPAIVIYADELGAIVGDSARLRFTKQQIAANLASLADIAQRGRSARIHLRLITQRPTQIGTFGTNNDIAGSIFASVVQRIHFDRESESLSAVFKHCAHIKPETMDLLETGTKGRCVYVFCEPKDGNQVKAGQIMALLDTNRLHQRFTKTYTGPPPLEFIWDEPEPKIFAPSGGS